MIDIGNTLDGSVEKAIAASEKLNEHSSIFRKIMLAGDFSLGNAKKIDVVSYKSGSRELMNYIAQVTTLDQKQRDIVLSMSNINDTQKDYVNFISKRISTGKDLNGVIVEQILKENDFSKAAVEGLTAINGLKDANGKYGIAVTSQAIPAMEKWINEHNTAIDATKMLNDNIITGTEGNYQFTDSFKDLIIQKQKDVEVTKQLGTEQLFWNAALQIGKQLLVSFAIGAFIAGVQKLIQAWKDYRDRFVNGMNDAHDAAEKAKSDVDSIQAKIDELNEKVKAAGADKISDIVDPTERAKLEAINENLEKQLKLKQQLQEIEEKKEHDNAVEVYNTKDEIVYKDDEGNYDYTMGIAPNTAGFKATAHESLDYYNGMLNKYTKKYNDLLATTADENDPALVSAKEQMDFAADEVTRLSGGLVDLQEHLSDTSDEYAEITAVLGDASDALSYYNGEVVVSTTAYDVLLKKMQATKNLMDRRNRDVSNSNPYTSAVKTLKTSGLETGDDIRELSMVPANQTKEQAAAIAVLQKAADDAHVTLDQFISALETVGLIAVRNVSKVKSLSDAMSALDNMQSAYQSCAEAVKEYNKTGYVSMDTLQSLCQLEPQYLKMLELKNGKLKINTKTAQTLTQANLQLAKASLLADTLNKIKDTNTLAKAEALLGDVTAVIKDADTAIDAAVEKSAQQAKDSDGYAGYDKVKRAGDIYKQNYHTLSELFDKLGKQKPDDIWGKDDKSSKQTSSAIDAWSTLSSAMKEYNEQGYITFQTLKNLTDLEDKYSSMLKKNDVTGQLEMRTNDFYELMKAELKEAQIKGDGASEAQYNKILKWTNRNIKDQTMSYWDLVAAIEGYSSALSEAKEITDGFKSAWDNGKTVKQKTEKSRTGALDYEGTEAQSSALQDLLKYSEYDPTLIEKAYNQETGKIDLSGDTLKTAVVASLREQAKAARTEGGAAADAIAASYEKSANNIEGDVISVQDYFDGLGSTIDEINEKIDDMQSAWTDLNDVTNEYNIYDGLSVDALQKLLTMSPEYLACLQLEGGQLSVNADLMKDMLIKQLETKAALLESKDETRDQAKILREMIAQLEKNGISALSGLDQYAKNLEDTLSNIKSLFSDLLGVFEQANTDKSNDLKIQGDAWLEIIDKRIDALNEQNDAQERAIELSKAQDALEKAKTNKTVHVYHAGGSGFEWEADQNAVRDAQSTLDDTIRKNRKEDEIERLNKLKEAVQENNELIGSSFEDYEKKKKCLAEFDKMTYDDMISYNENWKNSILGNMKSTQVVTNVNEIITKIEKLITTLETLNNVLTWISTLGKSTDGGGLTGLFSNGGLLSKVGKFFNIASEDGLGAALNQTGEWFSGKLSAALEANPNNPIIKAFSNLWTAVGEGASKFFTETSGTGLGGIIKTGIEKAGTLISGLGGSNGVLGTIATTVKTGIGSIGTALTGGSSAIPVIGPIIAVAVNNAVQQFGKISKENTKIWADQNSTTGEKIVSSIGNVLYHLSPVEGWDKSVQYAKMAAEGEGLWQKLEYGAKSLYYATGLGVMLDNIWSTIKSILKVFGIKFKDSGSGDSTPSSTEKKKWYDSKFWFWNWGKKAKGDKKIKKSAPYNVDEEGDEIIVRKPQTGRMTYLEKGDGVIPANETENLMTIGKNPLKWLTENVGKILGSSAAKDVVEGKVDEGAVTKASQVLANSVVNTFSSAWNTVKMSTEDLIDSMNDSFQGGSTSVTTAAGTILSRVKTMFGKFNMGKLLGSFSSGVSGAISKSAKEYSSTTELLSGTKSKTIDTMNKMRSTFESTWASVAKETGVSKDKITSISSEMFSKMETLVNQTYDAIDSNAGMSSDQLNDITKSLFQSMQSIYTSGWNAVYATSTGMSQETANTLNSAYKSSSDSCTQAMDTIRNTMVGSWEQCGGGVQNLASGTYQTLSKAWADSSGSAEKMLYDTRACFDSSWGAVEQGVSNLANNPKDKLSTAWAEITSQSNATFGAEGTLKTDADNAWKNVEPGATNLSKNMQWTMDQAYLATKQGCSDTVNSVNTNLNSTSAGFSAIASAIDNVNKKGSDSEEVAKKTGHAWYEWVLNPVGTLLDTITKYNTEDKSKNNFLQNAVHTVTHPVSSLVEAGGKALKYVGNAAKNFLGGLFGKHASGLKSASKSHFANVDELGPELLVRKPQSGRYTYLETGDGVVPADITSKLFEMGGNPNKWFSEQMAKYGSQAITTKSTGNTSFSTGNIVINTPVGNSEDLASEIKKNFSTRMAQEWNKR